MTNIAIIGMQGCGKTVFVTTLAKRLSIIDDKGTFLKPKNARTLKYVEEQWQRLNNHDWPPSTPPGHSFELEWELHTRSDADWNRHLLDGRVSTDSSQSDLANPPPLPSSGDVIESDLRIVDAAGQDLRQIFDDDRIASPDSLPEHFRPLADYCRKADIVLFLANLKDFIPGGDESLRTENEAALNSAMDHLGREGKSCCVLFTQADQYSDYVAQAGGWNNVLKTHISYIYGGHLANRTVPYFPVAAVNDTTIVTDRRVPKPAFTSKGFDDVFAWVIHAICDVNENLRIQQIVKRLLAKMKDDEISEIQKQETENKEHKEHAKTSSWIAGVVSFFISFFLLMSQIGWKKEVDVPWGFNYDATNWSAIFFTLFVAGILSVIIAVVVHSIAASKAQTKRTRFAIDDNPRHGSAVSGTAQFSEGQIVWKVNENGKLMVTKGEARSDENINALKSWLNQFGELIRS